MSIGYKKQITVLQSTSDSSKKIEIVMGSCICSGDGTVTILSYGDEMYDFIYDLSKNSINKTTESYIINGMSDAQIRFTADAYGLNNVIGIETGRHGLGNSTTYKNELFCKPWGSNLSASDGSFRGCGLYFFIDNTTEKPLIFIGGMPAILSSGKAVRPNPPFTFRYKRNYSEFENNMLVPYYPNVDFYIFRNYSYSDYNPAKAGGVTINGFPYGDGESTSQGGQGEMTDTSDPIEIDSKPLLTTGDFLRVYKLTATDLSALQAKLISNGFLDNLITKLRTDAMDYIVGLNAIPISTTNVAASTIKIANLDTEIAASYLTWYIEDFDFGEIELKEYFQTFMDYSPYTKLSAYIPYCGIVPLNVDDFMNDKISMKCRVDMLTGQFVVFVSNSVGVVTTVSGNCAYQLPIRANDYNRLVTSGLGLLGGIVGTAGALATGNVPLAIGAGLGTTGALVATSQAMTKPDVTSKGSLGGNYGLLGNRTPYLIIQRPTISVPSDYGKTIGYMSRITAKLGDLTGYTVVEEIHLEHISATDDEKKLIENALKSGVIL